ncbi:MAG: hypothetical protein AABZ74_13395 [Cyanobacteriota bacterium]
MVFDKKEILEQLDKEAQSYSFPMLDNGYYFHGDQKLTIFRDEKRWAILLEVLSYSNRSYGLDGITIIAATFGNCILTEKLYDNDNFFNFATDSVVETETILYDEKTYISYLNPIAKSIKVKGIETPITFDIDFYKSKGISLEENDKISPWAFMRGLIPEKSHLFWVTREEISKKIPIDLPIFMTIDEWHHPNLVIGEKPSETETFNQLAEVIATGDKSFYNTSEKPNTHWKNWPDGGSL